MKSLLIILLKVIVAIAIGVAVVHLWPVTIVPMMVPPGPDRPRALFLICLVTVGTAGLAVLASLLAVAACWWRCFHRCGSGGSNLGIIWW